MSLGERLRAVRITHALSPEQLAQISRVSNRTIRLLENGKETVKPEVIVRLAVALQEDIAEWLELGGHTLDPEVTSRLTAQAEVRQKAESNSNKGISKELLVSFTLPSQKRIEVKLYNNGGIQVNPLEEKVLHPPGSEETLLPIEERRISFTLQCNQTVKVQVYTNGHIEVTPL